MSGVGGVCDSIVDIGVTGTDDRKDHRAFLAGLIDGMRCGILAVDRAGRLVLLNEVGAQILDVCTVPPQGVPITEALPGYPEIVRVLMDSFTMTSLPNRAELDVRAGSSDAKTIGFTVSLVPGSAGEAAGAAIFFKDLTRIEHREEQERLRDRLAALGQMAASMAHEIRNPLAAIEVSCSLLKRRLGPDGRAEDLLGKIATEVRRLNQTITSSLEFVKPVSLNLGEAELQPALEQAIEVATRRHGRSEVRVRRRFAESLPPFLMDRDQLRQVFENLILNALEAVGETGEVIVETCTVAAPDMFSVPYARDGARSQDPWQHFERFAVVRVADSGPGVADSRRDKIFHPFYTTKKQGSGVGLAMVKKIVNSHRGLIDVDEAPEGGALFTVRLPMTRSTTED